MNTPQLLILPWRKIFQEDPWILPFWALRFAKQVAISFKPVKGSVKSTQLRIGWNEVFGLIERSYNISKEILCESGHSIMKIAHRSSIIEVPDACWEPSLCEVVRSEVKNGAGDTNSHLR